jgi:uncharacterized membrane-anchored protein
VTGSVASHRRQRRPDVRQAGGKVPPVITGYFWVIKILTTGMGEAAADFLDHRINPFLAGAVAGLCFVTALVLQVSKRVYIPWVYWLAVSMVAVFGTMAADGLHVELGIPYVISTAFYFVVLLVVFATWYGSEHTLSIHSITSRRREMFYWATVLATFALGTAAGDFTATTLHLGYFSSGVLFMAAFLIPGLAFRFFGLSPVVAFWFSYVLTRPLGASFADWMGFPQTFGALGLGRGTVAIGLAIPIVALVAYVSATRQDTRAAVEPLQAAAPLTGRLGPPPR